MLPTKNFRSHIVIFRDWLEINITEQQYQSIRHDKENLKSQEMITIRDIDNWNILYDWEIGAIKQFKERKQSNCAWVNWICWYWEFHAIWQKCECRSKFKISELDFRHRARKLYWTIDKIIERVWLVDRVRESYNALYMQDLTYSQKQNIIK